MADGEPEIGSRLEKRAHDRLNQIEVARSPLAQPHAAVIGVFIERRTIKTCEGVFVRDKVNGHKVHNDTDAVLVALVNQIAEIFRCTIARSDGKITALLISPRSIKGMFCERKKFDVIVEMRFAVWNQ